MQASRGKRPALAALVLALCLSFSVSASAEKRVALVIGNGAYQNAAALPNPPHDARDVAAARDADVAIFYYSGHALQFSGVNYLMPVDASLSDEADLRFLLRVDDVVADLQQARNLRILVLDACRDNPFVEALKRSIPRSRGASLDRGLAKIDSPQGMIVAYATQAGRTAEDGSGRNSPYTSAFLKHIEEQEEIGTVFRRVSADVYEATRHTQLPELSLSLIGEFYLKGRSVAVPTAASSEPAVPDQVSKLEQRLKTLEEQLKAGEQKPVAEQKAAAVNPPPRLVAPAAPASPAALPPAAGAHDPVGTVTAFYGALSSADGRSAVALVVPEKRGTGPYVEANITQFYSSLREPLKVISIERIDADHVGVKYRFVRPGGGTCTGDAKVNTIFQNGKTFIKSIAANC